MSFVSYGFVAFMTVCLLAYYITPKKFRYLVLLLASYVFYILAMRRYVIYLFVTTVTVYGAGILIDRIAKQQKAYIKAKKEQLSKEEKKAYKASMKKKQKTVLVICLLLNFGVLAFLKYANFVIANVNFLRQSLFHNTNYISFFSLVLPLGISFYTFQATGYLIDIYFGKYEAERHFGKFALFVSFFPQIIQGPISRFDELSKTLFEGHDYDFNNLVYGFYQIMWGLFKKLLIADRVASYVANTIASHRELGGGYILLAIFLYSMQIYADFSGGIDITIGSARMFGVSVTKNFDRPFFSKSVAEYWRRWHITLGTWFKDYIFYPLSIAKWTIHLGKWIRTHINENLGKKVPIYVSMFIVWFTTGLWHGAEWRYIIWGMLNFLILAVSTELEPYYDKWYEMLSIRKDGRIRKFWQVFRTFWIMSFLRVFDISAGVKDACSVIRGVFYNFFDLKLAKVEELGLPMEELRMALFACLVVLCVSLLQRKGSIRDRIMKSALPVRWACMAVLVITVIVFGSYGIGYDARDFIYLQF